MNTILHEQLRERNVSWEKNFIVTIVIEVYRNNNF